MRRRGPCGVLYETVVEEQPSGRYSDKATSHSRAAGGGNYQTLINDALVAHIQQQSILVAVRRVVREEIAKLVVPAAPTAAVARGGRRGA